MSRKAKIISIKSGKEIEVPCEPDPESPPSNEVLDFLRKLVERAEKREITSIVIGMTTVVDGIGGFEWDWSTNGDEPMANVVRVAQRAAKYVEGIEEEEE